MKHETGERIKGDDLRQDSDEPKEQGIINKKEIKTFLIIMFGETVGFYNVFLNNKC